MLVLVLVMLEQVVLELRVVVMLLAVVEQLAMVMLQLLVKDLQQVRVLLTSPPRVFFLVWPFKPSRQ